jgi:hypothetical protein
VLKPPQLLLILKHISLSPFQNQLASVLSVGFSLEVLANVVTVARAGGFQLCAETAQHV